MATMILDPELEREVRERREASDADRWTEVWEGVVVMPPLPNDEHQEIQLALGIPLYEVVQQPGLGKVRPGVNVSDRHDGWTHNYRGPDVVVYLDGNPAVNHGTHWTGGPDFLVEIISPGEEPQAKFDFYAKVGTREVMTIDRNPWAVELHRLQGGRLVLVGRSDLAGGAELVSGVLPLAFRLVPGKDRPAIAVRHTGSGKTWTV